MNPRLQVIDGTLYGETYPLAEPEFTIGRALSNRLCLNDSKISRMHCVITRDEAGFKIKDLGSHNGTFVNTIPVTERRLDHGDKISVGLTHFIFLTRGEAPGTFESTVEIDESEYKSEATITHTASDTPYQGKDISPGPDNTRDLNTLFKISMAINSVRELETFQRKLIELLFDVVPAERGAIFLVGKTPDHYASVFGLDRIAGSSSPVTVSRTIIQQVLREGVALLKSDISRSDASAAPGSVIASRIESLVCAPLMILDRILGAIYLDTRDRGTPFNESHLQLLTAIAAIAAIAAGNVLQVQRLERENLRIRTDLGLEHNMVGKSRQMNEVYRFINKVASTDSTVLILGESGTGKELVARAIHQNSSRAEKPFVTINCPALAETLLENELFGHEKGAFTGAVSQRAGKLEAADGGTVFLDEMGELAPTMQAKLLRVLQTQEFERVGGTRPVRIDVRLIAATNRDLEQAIRDGEFREDLYYRLNVVSLRMPPLRERREDIPLLAEYFAQKCGGKAKRRIRGISAEAQSYLSSYDWPGNVRELENAIERAVVLGSTDLISSEDLPEPVLDVLPSKPNHREKVL